MKSKNKTQVMWDMLLTCVLIGLSSMLIVYGIDTKSSMNLTLGIASFGLSMLAAMMFVMGILFIRIDEEKEKVEKLRGWL